MTPPHDEPGTSRRGFLGLVGLGAASIAGGGLLTGCSTPSGRRPGSGGATAAAADKLKSLTPSYVPFQGVKPEIPGTISTLPGVPDVGGGYLTYPSPLADAVSGPAGKGGSYKAMTPLWGPPPPGLTENAYFQACNADIGATVDFQIADGTTYVDKVTARLAANDIPELVVIPQWEIEKMADFNRAVDKAFEDLTPYLQGDKVKAYPMLANLPTAAWAFSVFSGRLAAVPFPTEPFPLALLYRKDIFDQHSDWAMPTTAEELFALGKSITDAKAKRWAFGDIHEMVWPIFKVPQEWRLDGGKLLYKYETPEFEAMIAFMRRMFEAELIHPNVSSRGANEKDLFASGQIVIYRDGLGAWKELLQQHRGKNPDFAIGAVPLFSHDGSTPIMYHNNPAGIFTFVRKGLGADRIQEILSILNWCAAPFGTKEYELATYGVEGKHYTRDAKGVPQFTDLGRKEAQPTYVFLGGRPIVADYVAYPDAVRGNVEWQNASFKYIEKTPLDGIRHQRPSRMAGLQLPTEDKFTDVMRGRRPVSDIKQIVAEWRRDGGDEAREFYMKVLRDNGRA
ncbi:sugar ABC transporter substrate-binding protein [Sphaerisporangium melleum]|uniref:Sugar ABC transporter substrate-binding protein n=1 Tax=Sphaerisporangium melleum TaxID=321316 RepID=A0A917RCV1_9ACTN|nr:extracellular solute-binding protein [Sphaerisporangium melleum]GGK99883.1 sugar ABC transporter substrate-binding protein [Sphaerisporangium melleum]GII71287.1 sugar ABC transporter substrate-binding protein [Sphaerisporangium melleum]